MIILAPVHHAQIALAAVTAYPYECCGLLVGRGTIQDGIDITDVIPAKNLRSEPDRFELDPALYLRVQRELREAGGRDRVVGHYHSHPNGQAIPSNIDLAEANDPNLVWVIVGTDGATADIAAFKLADGKFVSLKL